jgi:NADH:ubiquinone oxidoreductase subunit E
MFSLEVVSCMGACSLSPVISINGTFYDHVTLAKIRDILLLYRNREEGENGRD